MTTEDDFDEFVRARWTATARLAYALTLDHQKAEDLAQEAFTKLWFHWRKLHDGNPEAYLRKIVATSFLSGRRRRWLGERPTDAPPDAVAESGTAQVDERLALHQAMARLSPRQRAAVYLRYAEDLSERTVADLLGCSVGAVKQHTRRGLEALRADITFGTPDELADLAEKGDLMTDDPNNHRLPDDLGAKLAVLTDERPEPADPAAPIRLRIKRRRLQRRTTAAALCAAAATAAVIVASSVLGSVRSAEPGVATPSPSPTPAMRTQNLEFTYTPLPKPWSEEGAFTTQPDSLKYAPAFYVARGSIPNESWAVASYYSPGCLVVTDEGPAKSFGGTKDCFHQNWRPGERAKYRTIPAVIPNLGSPTDLTMVMGAVSADARTVRVTAGGKTYDTEAVGTPNSSRFRFFALVVDAAESGITAVTPLTATGQPAPAPRAG